MHAHLTLVTYDLLLSLSLTQTDYSIEIADLLPYKNCKVWAGMMKAAKIGAGAG